MKNTILISLALMLMINLVHGDVVKNVVKKFLNALDPKKDLKDSKIPLPKLKENNSDKDPYGISGKKWVSSKRVSVQEVKVNPKTLPKTDKDKNRILIDVIDVPENLKFVIMKIGIKNFGTYGKVGGLEQQAKFFLRFGGKTIQIYGGYNNFSKYLDQQWFTSSLEEVKKGKYKVELDIVMPNGGTFQCKAQNDVEFLMEGYY